MRVPGDGADAVGMYYAAPSYPSDALAAVHLASM